jgi:hypothetical protein
VIIRHAAACNFSLDSLLFFEIFLDVIVRVAVPRLFVPIRARHAQTMLEFIAPQLQIGSG